MFKKLFNWKKSNNIETEEIKEAAEATVSEGIDAAKTEVTGVDEVAPQESVDTSEEQQAEVSDDTVQDNAELADTNDASLPKIADDEDVEVPVPPLAMQLYRAESEKGEPLTEVEVIAIRDAAVTFTLTGDKMRRMDKSRGFADVSYDSPWDAWQKMRLNPPKGIDG